MRYSLMLIVSFMTFLSASCCGEGVPISDFWGPLFSDDSDVGMLALESPLGCLSNFDSASDPDTDCVSPHSVEEGLMGEWPGESDEQVKEEKPAVPAYLCVFSSKPSISFYLEKKTIINKFLGERNERAAFYAFNDFLLRLRSDLMSALSLEKRALKASCALLPDLARILYELAKDFSMPVIHIFILEAIYPLNKVIIEITKRGSMLAIIGALGCFRNCAWRASFGVKPAYTAQDMPVFNVSSFDDFLRPRLVRGRGRRVESFLHQVVLQERLDDFVNGFCFSLLPEYKPSEIKSWLGKGATLDFDSMPSFDVYFEELQKACAMILS